MAVKVLDEVKLDNGLNLTNLIISLKGCCALVKSKNLINNDITYSLTGTFYYYVDQTKDYIFKRAISYTFTLEEIDNLTSNLISKLYNRFVLNEAFINTETV